MAILREFHVHTNFSDGRDTPEEMVRAAIARGMTEIGFSDHSPTWFDESYCINLSNLKVEGLRCDYLNMLAKCHYVGNGKLYAYGFAYALDPDNPNTYVARLGVPVIVDIYNKTAKVIEGLPLSNGHGIAMGRFGNKMVYGSANDEYNGFSTVDLTTGQIETKVATVDGFPSFFYSFE